MRGAFITIVSLALLSFISIILFLVSAIFMRMQVLVPTTTMFTIKIKDEKAYEENRNPNESMKVSRTKEETELNGVKICRLN